MINPRPSDPPPLIEVLAVWGWAVQHSGIPLAYAAAVVADHPVYTDHSGVPDPTPDERLAWATEDLRSWEDVVVRMDWPGDDEIRADWWERREQEVHRRLADLRRRLLQHEIDTGLRALTEADPHPTDEGQDR